VRKAKTSARPAGWRLFLEVLEDRTVLDVTPAVVPLPDSVSLTWQGATRTAAAGQWIAQFNNVSGTPDQQVQAVQQEVTGLGSGVSVLQQLGADGLVLLQVPSAMTYNQLCAGLNGMADCSTIEPNFNDLASSALPNDPLFGSQWDLRNTGQFIGGQFGTPGADINATAAWNLTTGSQSVVVGVIDSGINLDHPDLFNNIWLNQKEIPTLPFTPAFDQANNLPAGSSRASILKDLTGDGLITFADLNFQAPDGSFPDQGPGKIVGFNGSHVISASNILTAMNTTTINGQLFDTGTGGWSYAGNTQDGDTAHPNDFVGWNFESNNNFPFDDNGHGTHVAGTIGAVGNNGTGIAGINWNVQMMSLKFLNALGGGSTADAISAVNYATEKAREGVNIKLTNNSWGGPGFSQDLSNAIDASGKAGLLFVAAAGNSGTNNDTTPVYPANFNLPNVVAVAATDNQDHLASFSNFGPNTVALAAPGVNILSTELTNSGLIFNPTGYGTLSGTSMAAPHVSGVAALAYSYSPHSPLQDVKAALINGVDKLPGLSGVVSSGGRLDTLKTLQLLQLKVVGSTPASGDVLTTQPVDFTLDFSDAFDPASVTAGAFTVNGIAANSFTVNDPFTLTFHFSTSPVTQQGLQSMDMAAGAIKRLRDGSGSLAFHANFRYAAVRLQVTSTDPANGSFVPLPFTQLRVHFNLPYDPTTIGTSNLTLSEGTVTAAVAVDATTVQYTLSGIVDEGPLTASMAAGAVTDQFGNPMLPFSGTYNPDIITAALPTPTPVNPLGSLIYESDYPHRAIISPSGDTANFTLAVNAGQTLAVVIHPLDPSLQPTVQLFGPDGSSLGSASAGATGSDALLQATPAATAGTYTVTVGGAKGTTGGYTVQVFVNTAVQAAAHGGPSDSTPATAQPLDPSFVPLGASADRGAIRGTFAGGSDFTSFQLNAGQTVSAGLHLFGQPLPLFGTPATFDTGGPSSEPVAVVTGDLRGNGITDMVVATQSFVGPTLLIYYGNGDGTFQSPVSVNTAGSFHTGLARADLRGNGKLDIVVTDSSGPNFGPGGVDVLLNDGTGTHFSDTFYTTGGGTTGVAVGDVVGNGKQDIVVTSFNFFTGFDGVTVLYGNGDGTFGKTASFAVTGAVSVALGDLRGTGRDDIVVGISSFVNRNAFAVLLNDGTGTGFTTTGYSLGINVNVSGSVAIGDLRGIGKLDIVTSFASFGITVPSSVAVFLGKGDGTFGTPTFYASGGSSAAVALGDLTGDGRLDIVTTNPSNSGGTISVLLNDGHGGFAPHQDFDAEDAGTQRFGLALADFRGNGLLDVATANFNNGNVSVLLNQTDHINVQIQDASGNVLAEGRPGATNLDEALNNFVAPASGTYYAVITGAGHRDFDLVVTRGADFSTEPNNDLTTAQPLVVEPNGQLAALGNLGAGNPADTYEIAASPGQTVTIQTATPFPGPNPFAASLDPMVQVLDDKGNLVASDDNSAPDGLNASLTLKLPTHGGRPYFIQVLPSTATASPTAGPYVLRVSGAASGPAHFQVSSTDPANGAFLNFLPLTMSVTFNHNLLLPTLAAADFQVDGLPAASFTVKDGSTVTFPLPTGLPNQETHVVTVSGPITDVSGTPLDTYTGQFFVNNTPPNVIASSIQEGDTMEGRRGGSLTYTVQFSEPLQAQTVTAAAVTLHGNGRNQDYAPASINYVASSSTLTVTYSGLPDDHYRLQIADSLTDNFGLKLDGETTVGGQSVWPIGPGQGHSGDGAPGGGFAVDFTADFPDPMAYPTPLTPVAPLGSLIYQGAPTFSTIVPASVSDDSDTAGDTDRWTLAVNAGQTLTVLVRPLSAGLQPTAVVSTGPGHSRDFSATAPAAGVDAIVQTAPITADGTYTITVSGANGTTGDYTIQVFLNTALQAAAFGGPSDGTPATAQNIEPSFLSLPQGSGRGAVDGTFKGGNDLFSFNLNAGQSVTLGAVLSANGPLLSAPTTVANGFATGGEAIAAGDLNGDGKTDLVVANFSNTSISVLLGNGDGTFKAPQTYFIGGFFPTAVALADLRGTGKLDIVVSTEFSASFNGGGMDVLFNNGDGTFGPSQNYSTFESNSQGLAVGNFTGHGKRDVAVVNFNGTTSFGTVSVFLNNGNGTFGTFPRIFLAGAGSIGITAADLRGTGKDDIVVADFNNDALTSGGLTVMLNDGTGTNFGRTELSTGGSGTEAVAVGDLAGDGKQDIVAENSFGKSVSVLDGNGDGTFGAPTLYATASFPWALALGDLGHRGKLDIITANFFGSVSVLVNNGDGTFGPHQDFAGGDSHEGHQDLALGDFNGDGFLDVASANFNTPTVSIEFDQFSQVSLQLLDANDMVLQSATRGPTNLDLVLSDFVAPQSGTYFARLIGAGVPRGFDLVITRGADFDTHPNGTFATAQDISGTVGALGAIVPAGTGTSSDWYRVTAQDGQTLFFDTTVPSSGPGQFTNHLQPHIELYDPSDRLVASGVLEADGRNETITYTIPVGAAGAYRVRITGKSGTTGEYFLDPIETGGFSATSLLPGGGAAMAPVGLGGTGLPAADVASFLGDLVAREIVLTPAGPKTLADVTGPGTTVEALVAALGAPAGSGEAPAPPPDDRLANGFALSALIDGPSPQALDLPLSPEMLERRLAVPVSFTGLGPAAVDAALSPETLDDWFAGWLDSDGSADGLLEPFTEEGDQA
jgi:subtilisin family serine protease